MKTVLSIGTTHPWNIAGVGLDLRVGEELGVRVLTVVCAVSAQDARGVHALTPVPSETIDAQLACIPWNEIAAIRVGALGSPDAVHRVHAALAPRDLPAVIDPVIAATRGGRLADDRTVDAFVHTLLGLRSAILTPNLPEAQRLLGRAIDVQSAPEAAQELRAWGARAVLLKGGHGEGAPVDVLASADGTQVFQAPRIDREMRGTGCALAMALASALAADARLSDAVRIAREFVRAKIASAVEFGGIPAYSSADD